MLTGRWCGGTSFMTTPSIEIRPALGCAKPASIRSSVVLPQPEAPTSANISPLKISECHVVDRGDAREGLADALDDDLRRAAGSSHGRSASCFGSGKDIYCRSLLTASSRWRSAALRT